MQVILENTESQKSQEIGDLIRSYNRSKREKAESEPLNLYVEDDKGELMAGLVAETFGNWLEIEYLFVKEEFRDKESAPNYCNKQKVKLRRKIVAMFLSILISSKRQPFIKSRATRKSLL